MEQAAIFKELRRLEVDGEMCNGVTIHNESNHKTYLDDAMNRFFDDLRHFRADRDKESFTDYIALALSDLDNGERQLDNLYQAYCTEHDGEDLNLVRIIVSRQKEYTKQMRHRLEDVLSGKSPEERRTVIRKDEIDRVAYEELLSEYGDVLSTKDLIEIFKVTRQTIHNWEKEGKICRTNSQSGKPAYLKLDIKAFLIQNNPELVRVHREKLNGK